MRSKIFLCTTAVTALCSFSAWAAQVSDIRVVGSERVEPATVMTYLSLKKGDEVTQDALDQALKSLFATGLFADVQVSENSGIVTVKIVENPVINQVAFEGNKDLKDEQLQGEIQARSRQVFTRTGVQEDVARLYSIYQKNGRFSADIQPKIIKLDQNRVNLIFEISEGPVTEIDTIRFVGNNRFSADELRSELTSKEARWYSILSSNDKYDQDRLAYDQELLRQFYLKEGYADFRVLSAVSELSQDKDKFYITMTIDEGERYRINDIRINSQIRNLDPATLTDTLHMKVKDWYNGNEVKDSIDSMTKKLGDMQYAFVNVVPDINRNRENHTIDIVFNVNESPRVFVERINVDGNVRTLDKVIRRQIELSEGDPFNRSLLSKSEQNVKDLGYFAKVDVKTLPGSTPDKTVIDVNVEEQSTGSISLGAGFSTADGPLADFSIREKNLLGTGKDLGLAATIAGTRTEFDLSLTEPYFLDRNLLAGIDLFHTTRDQQDESSFDQKKTGFGARVGYPLSRNLRQTWKYRIEDNNITNVDSDASRYIRDQEGDILTSSILQRLDYSDVDSKLFPTDGYSAWFETELAGLGGDAKYIAGRLGGTYYYPIAKNWYINTLAEAGVISGYSDDDVRINERYFLGGNNLRGFETAGVGPRDLSTDDSLGGNQFYRGLIQLNFPLGLPEDLGVSGHVFSDFGSLWGIDTDSSLNLADEDSIRVAAGMGFSWRSPMGPLQIDFSAPIMKEDYDTTQVFRFNFGTQF